MSEMADDDLVQALRALRKGDGLTLGSLAMLPDLAATFGTDSLVAIRSAIRDAIASEAGDKCVDALANALALGEFDASTLMERREKYVKRHRMAMRSLTTYEEFGARVVAQLIHISNPGDPKDAQIANDMAVVEDVAHRLARNHYLTPVDQDACEKSISRLAELDDAQIDHVMYGRMLALVDQVVAAMSVREDPHPGPDHRSQVAQEGLAATPPS